MLSSTKKLSKEEKARQTTETLINLFYLMFGGVIIFAILSALK
jgi:hypothetical protein